MPESEGRSVTVEEGAGKRGSECVTVEEGAGKRGSECGADLVLCLCVDADVPDQRRLAEEYVPAG